MSDRLVLRQEASCECDSLRSQLESLQQSYNDLQTQMLGFYTGGTQSIGIEAPSTVELANSPVEDVYQSTYKSPQTQKSHDQEIDRTLRPTFFRRGLLKQTNRSSLSSAWELWGDDKNLEAPIDEHPEFTHETYTTLVDVFFDRRWPYFPVLHRPTLIKHHLKPFLLQQEVSPLSKFLVNIVCALAETEKPHLQGSYDCHRLFFHEASKYLNTVLHGDDFECLQCLLLLCMYGHNEPQSVDLGYTSALALQLAIGMDLHHKESLTGQTQLQLEMTKRVFWSAYVMNCSMSINLGRPLGIQTSDISMPLPLQLVDDELADSPHAPLSSESITPKVTDTSTFIHIIKLRRINACVYRDLHSVGCTISEPAQLTSLRSSYLNELHQWHITAPRYIRSLSTFQSVEWFELAFHHAVLSLYRPCRAAPMPSFDDLRICNESAIGLISSYSSLYARNRIKYTFVAIHCLFMAAVTMLYSLRASASLRQELTKPVVHTNIQTFLTLFRGISNGRSVGEKCSNIIERLGASILSLFDSVDLPDSQVDLEFQSWFGVQTHTFATPSTTSPLEDHPQDISTLSVDLPWADLFTEGVDMSFTDVWSLFS